MQTRQSWTALFAVLSCSELVFVDSITIILESMKPHCWPGIVSVLRQMCENQILFSMARCQRIMLGLGVWPRLHPDIRFKSGQPQEWEYTIRMLRRFVAETIRYAKKKIIWITGFDVKFRLWMEYKWVFFMINFYCSEKKDDRSNG